MPVVASAVAAPAASASPLCPEFVVRRGQYTYWSFSNLDAGSRWNESTSALSVRATLGALYDGGNYGALAYGASAEGITVATSSYLATVSYPVRVSWSSIPSGWSVVEESVGSDWRYSFSRTEPIPVSAAFTPLSNRPTANSSNNAIPKSGDFLGQAITVPWSSGTQVSNGPSYTFPTSYRVEYEASFPQTSCNTGPQVFTSAGTLNVSPSS